MQDKFEHEPTCESLPWLWTGRGPVCPSDFDYCDKCDGWFRTEGLRYVESDDEYLCECCSRG